MIIGGENVRYRNKPTKVEGVTFHEFVKYGLEHTTNIVNGMPWSFIYKGYPVTHENDKCYLVIQSGKTYRFTSDDILIITRENTLYPCNINLFNEIFKPLVDLCKSCKDKKQCYDECWLECPHNNEDEE